ncbi:molybdate ABC transporter permease subunit [Enhygromyxa salina]|uniref:Molybdenum transport system permease n=1 Tax=Enhygromyxa salina TaxID=215803 RepID=A0A2S9XU94_9BACT|nr:molybdate ABC transporter permease subunit [Enhygromyxa salina]PRP96447.1 Molybdenum transport system permease protein ModB [Enhygromyxa salina]
MTTTRTPKPATAPKLDPKSRGQGWGHYPLFALAFVGLALFVLPLLGLVVRAPLTKLGALFTTPALLEALRLSLVVSLAAVTLSLILGLPCAWVLARYRFPGRGLVRALLTLPMVLPPVVAGVALLATFGRRGLFGPAIEWLGVDLAFSTTGAVLAATFVAAPFLILSCEAALENVDPRLEAAAATLGASRLRILWTVTLPTIRPSLLAGLSLCWARALGEFGATITFAGNFQGRTQTMPLAVYETLQSDHDGALLLSLILLAVSLTILIALRGELRR